MELPYCGEMVRRHDPDRFLLTMFSAQERREALWALYAFNFEIAKTREVVTETQLGLIRLQWWRDSIAAVYAGTSERAHLVLGPLAAAIGKYALPQEMFDNLIYAREFDLEDRPPATLEGLINYADFTSTPLLKLSMAIEGRQAEEARIRAVAVGYALTGLLRAVPAHLGQRRCYLPEDLMHEAGTDQFVLYEGKDLDKVARPASLVAAAARERLAEAGDEKALRLHARLADIYLRRIEKKKCNLFSPALRLPPPFLALRLWWRSIG